MFNFNKLFKKENLKLSKDEIADLLKTTPDALQAFEEKYKEYSSLYEPNDIFEVNSRQASYINKNLAAIEPGNESIENIKGRIVAELLARTDKYYFDGNLNNEPIKEVQKSLPENTTLVSNEEIISLPEELRPQLTGTLMQIQVAPDSSDVVLMYYQKMLNAKKTSNSQGNVSSFSPRVRYS